MSVFGVQRFQIVNVVFYTKVLVNNILIGLERILDYAGVGLKKFDCMLFVVAQLYVELQE